MAREDFEDRRERMSQGIELARQARASAETSQARIIALRSAGYSIRKTAELAGAV